MSVAFDLTSPRFPNGTEVGAYPKSNWPNEGEPSGAPVGSAKESKTVTSDVAAFTALDDEVAYWAVAEVGGAYRYVSFVAGADTSAPGGQAELGAAGEPGKALAADDPILVFSGDATGATDIGPALQEAFDANPSVKLKPAGIYLINTPVFLDSSSKYTKYLLDVNGAEIKFGSGLPAASTMEGLAGTKWAFFVNTKRAALAAGTVTTSEANRAAGAEILPPAPQFVIRNVGLFNAQENIIGIAYGNNAATRIENATFRNIQVGISWTGYVDENSIEDCQTVGANPTGGTSTRLIYQRDSGDGTAAVNCKGFGAIQLDLAGSQGFRGSSLVSGECIFVGCEGVIDASHVETDEIGNKPTSYSLDRTKLTFLGNHTFAGKKTTQPTFKINDSVEEASATVLNLHNCTELLYYRQSDSADPARGPLVSIEALNKNGRVRAWGAKTLIKNGWTGEGTQNPESCLISSSVEAIQSALTAAPELIASGHFTLGYNGEWKVSKPGGMATPSREIAAPTLTAAPDTSGILGALTQNQEYSYVAACVSSSRYTTLSSEVKAKAGATKTNKLTLTNPGTPSTIILWRFKGASGVKAEPDSYIEVPLDGYSSLWIDTGTHLNGRPWITTGIPVPNTVAGTGSIFNRTEGVTALSATPGYGTWYPAALTSGTDTGFVSGKLFVAAVWIPYNKEILGIEYLIGSVGGTNKAVAQLQDAYGKLLGNSTTASEGTTVGTAQTVQALNLTSGVKVKGPALYFIGVSANGATAKLRTIPMTSGQAAAELSQTKAEPAAIVAPSTFTAGKGPIAWVF